MSLYPQINPAFNRDKFLLRQKLLSIGEKYYVWDEQGQVILFMERPAHLAQNLIAVFAALGAGFGVFILAMFLVSIVPSNSGVAAFLFLIGLIGAIAAFFIVFIRLMVKRNLTIYSDDTKKESLLQVYQDKKVEFLVATYTVKDATGELLARFRKNYLYDIFRKQWNCYNPDGSMLCMAKEDSILFSILRRLFGPFFGVLRTNFIIVSPNTERLLGEFNRKFTLLDRYVLDMTADSDRLIDRRIAVALGVMLDTGERR